ncbi:MAG: DUF6141 family protein [Planctomycetota bacterium]
MEPAFHEEQRLTQWWIRLIAVLMAALGWWAFVAQIVIGEPWGTNPAPDWAIWLILVFIGLALPGLLLFAKLVVTVDKECVRIRWIPFARRTLPLADIESAETRTYRPLLEYGGWGVRFSFRHGTAWNASGDRGVQLVLTTGKRLLIGSQRPEELEAAIRGEE